MSDGASFPAARMDDLAALMAFLDARFEHAKLAPDDAFALRLAAEEAFTNIVRHGYGNTPGPVRCTLDIDAHAARITFVDEAPTFDPSHAPAPDLEADLDERAEGGLGWHLIHQLMDEVQHTPHGGRGNTVTLIKRLKNP